MIFEPGFLDSRAGCYCYAGVGSLPPFTVYAVTTQSTWVMRLRVRIFPLLLAGGGAVLLLCYKVLDSPEVAGCNGACSHIAGPRLTLRCPLTYRSVLLCQSCMYLPACRYGR